MKRLIAAISAGGALTAGATALAERTQGGISMLPANSALAEQVHFFHNWILMPIITVISLFVLALLLWIAFRYRAKSNPTARKFSHNTLIEIVWTAVPILILLFIALPSFDLLYKEDVVPDGKQETFRGDGQTADFVFANDFAQGREVRSAHHLEVIVDDGTGARKLKNRDDYRLRGLGDAEVVVAFETPPAQGTSVVVRGGRSGIAVKDCPLTARYFDTCEKHIALAPTMTIKAVGYQWNWQYSYPDFGDFDFFSNLLPEDQATPETWLLEVDNRLVVPVGETIRIITTANDVIHSWAMPAFAVKIDAVPGRLNETWFEAEREGVFYGQCSEICGIKHAYMPIAVEVVSRPVFETWVDSQRALAGMDPMFDVDTVKLADADAGATETQGAQ